MLLIIIAPILFYSAFNIKYGVHKKLSDLNSYMELIFPLKFQHSKIKKKKKYLFRNAENEVLPFGIPLLEIPSSASCFTKKILLITNSY